ncbi:b69.2 [miniopterid betaherpesvirus 1]|uniref:B69.2 n=1 Tax=miniopterid betaherpesvirus 1 TaxID=3070189 RepID=I3VQ62_9BETA|nr:b69.2 [miniopterid betaherpesvirus 1]AFK83906.1 b69.2 [miniopterid betaherpesvirus 1]
MTRLLQFRGHRARFPTAGGTRYVTARVPEAGPCAHRRIVGAIRGSRRRTGTGACVLYCVESMMPFHRRLKRIVRSRRSELGRRFDVARGVHLFGVGVAFGGETATP